MCAKIAKEEQCRELLLLLYRSELAEEGSAANSDDGAEDLGKNVLRLTAGLSLFAGDTLLHRFSAEMLERELQEKVFLI